MKKISILFFFFFVFTLFVNYSWNDTFASLEYSNKNDILDNQSTNLTMITTETIYYLFTDDTNFILSIQCLEFNQFNHTTQSGLIIEVIDDESEEFLNGWKIVKDDYVKHNYPVINDQNRVLRIVFIPIDIEYVLVDWSLSRAFPIWTYSINSVNNSHYYFGIEREQNNETITAQIYLNFQLSQELEGYLNVEIYKRDVGESSEEFLFSKVTVDNTNISSNMIKVSNSVNNPYSADFWYRLKITSSSVNTSRITLTTYYNSYQNTSMIRLFSTPISDSLSNIPIDCAHRDFLWVQEKNSNPITNPPTFPPTYPPTNPFFPSILMIIIFAVISIILTLSAFLLTQVKKTKKIDSKLIGKAVSLDNNLREDIPTIKYTSQTIAAYEPNPQHSANLKEIQREYNVISNGSSLVKCSICYQNIGNQEIERCPSCDVAFHKEHLYKWLLEKNFCPICKSNIQLTKK